MSKKTSLFVFQDSQISQTGSIGPITLFTPTTDSDYHVSLYVENVTSTPTSTVEATLSWTDDKGTSSKVFDQGTGAGAGVSFPIHVKANNAVTLSGTDFGNSQQYTIYTLVLGVE